MFELLKYLFNELSMSFLEVKLDFNFIMLFK